MGSGVDDHPNTLSEAQDVKAGADDSRQSSNLGRRAMLRFRAPTLAALTFAFCALSSGTIANASPPIPIPPNPEMTWPAGTVCSYPVHVVATQNKSLLHEFSNGQVIITGKLTEQVTNLQTGRSESFKVNGPLRVIPHDDGTATVISHGRLFLTLSGSGDVGGPGMFIFIGRVVSQVSADGTLTSVSHVPNMIDICALLA